MKIINHRFILMLITCTLLPLSFAKEIHSSDQESFNLAGKRIVNFVDRAQDKLKYTHYTLGASQFNYKSGIYKVDCSAYVNAVVKKTDPTAYATLEKATKTNRPNTASYYNFIKNRIMNYSHWAPVKKVKQLRPGDLLVFRYKRARRGANGHIMIVLSTPKAVTKRGNAYLIKVADSTPYRHSNDTRARHQTGVGQGTMLLKANKATGQPIAYAWSVNARFKQTMKYAMARAI